MTNSDVPSESQDTAGPPEDSHSEHTADENAGDLPPDRTAEWDHPGTDEIILQNLASLRPRLPDEVVDLIKSKVDSLDPTSLEHEMWNMVLSRIRENPTARSAQLLWELPLEIRRTIYEYFLPPKDSIFEIRPIRQARDMPDGHVDGSNCPVCSVDITGISDADKDVHVNNCLKGSPTELPEKTRWSYKGSNNALALLLVNSQMCQEVATILYENYTFELDLSEHGVRFLDLPVIDKINQYGFSLSHGDTKFGNRVSSAEGNRQSNWIFSFARIHKLKLNIWGGTVPLSNSEGQQWKAKEKCLGMRQNLQSLVELLTKGPTKPHLLYLEVTLYDGDRGLDLVEPWAGFWRLGRGLTPRCSLLAADEADGGIAPSTALYTNERFIMQPLEAIRGLECPWFFRYQGNDRHTRYRLCMDYMRSQMRRHPSSGYVPNPEFIRHVSQLEDALRDWKEHLARQTAERNRKMEAERDAWVDATIEEWGSDDGHATQEEDGEEDGN